MKALIENVQRDQAYIVAAPPGFGKTYKTLLSLKKTRKKALMIFPLRALCDEVHLTANKLKIITFNITSLKESEAISKCSEISLIISTPECLSSNFIDTIESDRILIFDECHLIYYWGESFRYSLIENFESLASLANPLILLSATINEFLLHKFKKDLSLNYESLHFINLGNQKLKNNPHKIFFYFPFQRKWLAEDYRFDRCEGVNLIFCQYRKEVKSLEKKLRLKGHRVLSCVGGEAKEFIQKLSTGAKVDFIVATSVISHGVNLPQIKRIYFSYHVENIDFYIQMIGRGGREGDFFEVHTFNKDYFSQRTLFLGILNVLRKRISNKIKSFVY